MTDPAYDTAVRVHELTTRHVHRERRHYDNGGTTWDTWHFTTMPPLLEQLLHLQPASAGDSSQRGFRSQPPARIEALDTLGIIDQQAARWVRTLGYDDAAGVVGCIRLLHGLHVSQAVERRDAIRGDIRRWWTMARVATGWDSPAWRPANTCPLCGKRGTLRVRLMAQVASCVACHETWAPDTIGLLADHIRGENHDQADETGQTA